MSTTILSIQSSVAYGHVGNSAAVFPLQRLGVEVWPVHTVNFSNHTGYGAWRGPLLAADDVREVITGIEERDAMLEIDAVLSGYQGGEAIGDVILDAVARVQQVLAVDAARDDRAIHLDRHPATGQARVVKQGEDGGSGVHRSGFAVQLDFHPRIVSHPRR